jgi:hypothetical protein
MSKASDTLDATYISHYKFRNLPEATRDQVCTFAYRDGMIGGTVKEACDAIIEASENSIEGRRAVKALREGMAKLAEDGVPGSKKHDGGAKRTARRTARTVNRRSTAATRSSSRRTSSTSARRAARRTSTPASRVARRTARRSARRVARRRTSEVAAA